MFIELIMCISIRNSISKQEDPPVWLQEVYCLWRSSTCSLVLGGGGSSCPSQGMGIGGLNTFAHPGWGGSGVTTCPGWGWKQGYPCVLILPVLVGGGVLPCPGRMGAYPVLGGAGVPLSWLGISPPLPPPWTEHTCENLQSYFVRGR